MSLYRLLCACFVGLFVLLAVGCGGGGNSCEQTGTVEFVYTPAVRNSNGEDTLTYKLGQANTWTLQIKGVSSACLTGVKVTIPSGRPALPASVTLDANTGTLSTGVLTQHIEGECKVGSTVTGTSVNRVCPAGQTLEEALYVLLIRTDRVNNESQINTPIRFRPAS